MQFNLVPHPSTPPAEPQFKMWANVDHAAMLGAIASTNIWFGVGAPMSRFVLPQAEEPGRAVELWRTTCFEAFLRAEGGEGYREWNFAPSGEWAAYDFASYRERAGDPDVAAPYLRTEDNLTWWALGATIAVEAGRAWELGLSAVLEEKDGTISYWALAHPSGDKPDFHASDCFAARLA
ncbi:MAG TPA: DOMON-like domain-containing protein [Sphingomicrobium sp.]|nr:DOMON-like domain-containing protein [Sphingomicrobium sp.]